MSVFLLHTFTFANDFQTFSEKSSKNIQLTEIDSAEIYQNLLSNEYVDTNYVPNLVGISLGSILVGHGIFFLSLSIYAFDFNEDFSKEITSGVGAAMLTSVAMITLGVPILVYNIRKYNERMVIANKRNEYYKAYKRYESKKKKESVQWMIFPAVDFANANASLNAVVTF
jgi:hypothetical protein